MLEKEILLTAAGLQKLESELEHLKTYRRKEVADRIKTAISFGDISENAEYDDAKKEQAFLEGRIANLEKNLRHVRIVDTSAVAIDQVGVGTIVRLKDLDFGDELEYTLVGSPEANAMQGRISNESPVGKALMGHQAGTILEVEVPAGVLRYEILDIRR